MYSNECYVRYKKYVWQIAKTHSLNRRTAHTRVIGFQPNFTETFAKETPTMCETFIIFLTRVAEITGDKCTLFSA